jgi:hypothetical protein
MSMTCKSLQVILRLKAYIEEYTFVLKITQVDSAVETGK